MMADTPENTGETPAETTGETVNAAPETTSETVAAAAPEAPEVEAEAPVAPKATKAKASAPAAPEAPKADGETPAASEAPAAPEPVTNTVTDLADLGTIAGDAPQGDAAVIAQRAEVPLREQILDKQGRAYATGRRKDATARVWVKPGTGKITVNGKDQEVYFARPTLRLIIDQPFTITERQGQYDVVATVKGGGLSGQAGAVKHGISQALTKYEPALRGTVKAAGFLTRDSRVVERKKFGRAKARKSFQFSKR